MKKELKDMFYWSIIMRKKCNYCLNDYTVRNIKIDSVGKCNFCKTFDEYYDKLHDYKYLKTLFIKKINNEKQYTYDVAVGFSGGKDSTYVLYKLVKEYNLRVYAYTLDNGFLSDEAKQRINDIIDDLNVKHEYVECDTELLKKIYKKIVNKYLSPCIACSFLGYAVMINQASKVNAKVTVHGRSTYQMFRNFADDVDDVFKPFIFSNLEEDVDLDKLYNEILNKIEILVDKDLKIEIQENLLQDAYQRGFREFIGYFLYHPYNKEEVLKFLKENTVWDYFEEVEHFDCKIHYGAWYLKSMIARRNHQLPELSVMIREGHLTRKEGEQKVNNIEFDKKRAKKELKLFCNYTNVNYYKLMLKAKIYSKRWW